MLITTSYHASGEDISRPIFKELAKEGAVESSTNEMMPMVKPSFLLAPVLDFGDKYACPMEMLRQEIKAWFDLPAVFLSGPLSLVIP